MTITPPFAIQIVRAMSGVIREFHQLRGTSDSSLSRQIFAHSDGLNSIHRWNGSGRSPTLDTFRRIEEHLRINFDDDADRSESLYQQTLDRELRKQRDSLRA